MQIITIGRQFGSGGHQIGQKIAKALQMKFYDKNLISMAAKESGLAPEFFEQSDERRPFRLFSGPLDSVPFGSSLFQNTPILSDDALFQIQSDIIRSLSQEHSCLFMGRCADYILRNHPDCISIFIHAPIEARIRRVMEHIHEYSTRETSMQPPLSEKHVHEYILKKDKARAAYYNYYTGKTWGAAASYHLCFDSELDITDTLIGYLTKTQS